MINLASFDISVALKLPREVVTICDHLASWSQFATTSTRHFAASTPFTNVANPGVFTSV